MTNTLKNTLDKISNTIRERREIKTHGCLDLSKKFSRRKINKYLSGKDKDYSEMIFDCDWSVENAKTKEILLSSVYIPEVNITLPLIQAHIWCSIFLFNSRVEIKINKKFYAKHHINDEYLSSFYKYTFGIADRSNSGNTDFISDLEYGRDTYIIPSTTETFGNSNSFCSNYRPEWDFNNVGKDFIRISRESLFLDFIIEEIEWLIEDGITSLISHEKINELREKALRGEWPGSKIIKINKTVSNTKALKNILKKEKIKYRDDDKLFSLLNIIKSCASDPSTYIYRVAEDDKFVFLPVNTDQYQIECQNGEKVLQIDFSGCLNDSDRKETVERDTIRTVWYTLQNRKLFGVKDDDPDKDYLTYGYLLSNPWLDEEELYRTKDKVKEEGRLFSYEEMRNDRFFKVNENHIVTQNDSENRYYISTNIPQFIRIMREKDHVHDVLNSNMNTVEQMVALWENKIWSYGELRLKIEEFLSIFRDIKSKSDHVRLDLFEDDMLEVVKRVKTLQEKEGVVCV